MFPCLAKPHSQDSPNNGQYHGPHELTKYYGDIVNSINTLLDHPETDKDYRPNQRLTKTKQDNRTTTIMKTLQAQGILIKSNGDHAPEEGISTYPNKRTPVLENFIEPLTKWSNHTRIPNTEKQPPNQEKCKVPYIDTYEAWTAGHKTWTKNTVTHICTDGSTYTGKPSGAALVFIEKKIKDYELWATKGLYWKLKDSDNYIAEMSAINKALRVLPIDVNVTVWTDSLSSIQAINKIKQGSSNYTRMSARPYLRSIKRIIDFRTAAGTITTINHIKSHTGFRDPASIGNSEADRLARYMGVCTEPSTDCGIDLLVNELPFVVWTTTTTMNDQGNPITTANPIHGDIRKALKKQQMQRQLAEWSERPTRGELIREHKNKTLSLINNTWIHPTSITIQFLLDILNQADKKNFHPDSCRNDFPALPPHENPYGRPTTSLCTNCSRHIASDTQHRLIDCPSVADIWNEADEAIWRILQLEPTFHMTNTPTTKRLCAILNSHMKNAKYDKYMIWNLITRCDSASNIRSLTRDVTTTTNAATTGNEENNHLVELPETYPCKGKCEHGDCVCKSHAERKGKQPLIDSHQATTQPEIIRTSPTEARPNKRTCLGPQPHDDDAVTTENEDYDHLAENPICKAHDNHKRKQPLLDAEQEIIQPEIIEDNPTKNQPSKRACLGPHSQDDAAATTGNEDNAQLVENPICKAHDNRKRKQPPLITEVSLMPTDGRPSKKTCLDLHHHEAMTQPEIVRVNPNDVRPSKSTGLASNPHDDGAATTGNEDNVQLAENLICKVYDNHKRKQTQLVERQAITQPEETELIPPRIDPARKPAGTRTFMMKKE